MINNRGVNNPMYGKKHSEQTKEKMRSKALGRKLSKETRDRLSHILKGKNKGKKHGLWKGDDVSYGKLHAWIRVNYPPPERCQNCNEVKPLDACNITGIYNRELKNWKYMCKLCHYNNDIKSYKRDPRTGKMLKIGGLKFESIK